MVVCKEVLEVVVLEPLLAAAAETGVEVDEVDAETTMVVVVIAALAGEVEATAVLVVTSVTLTTFQTGLLVAVVAEDVAIVDVEMVVEVDVAFEEEEVVFSYDTEEDDEAAAEKDEVEAA